MPTNTSGEFVINKSNPQNVTAAGDPISKGTNKARFYSSLCVYPTNVTFQNQEANEEIVLLIRRDLITNVPWIVFSLFLITVPFIISFFSNFFTPFFNVSANTILISLLFYYLIVFGYVLVQFSIWYFTIGIVTNKRIIDMDLTGILSKHISETRLNLVEDVSYEQTGSIRTIFNYGDVHIQTAGTFKNFEFDRVPEPALIVRIIADMIGGGH